VGAGRDEFVRRAVGVSVSFAVGIVEIGSGESI
jgi:hypothetical protein